MTPQLQEKIDRSIKLLQSVAKFTPPHSPIEVAYSGGKDSDVILQLVRESGIPYRAIYKNTTIDPPGTIKHVKDMGVEILMPRNNTSFFKLVAKKGFPNRLKRFCCRELKEYKVLDKVVIGVRREESNKRAARYTEPTACVWYGARTPENHAEAIYPILDWTTDDVAEFLKDRGIKCAPVYYDEQGNFHPERRLGCMCCPLASTKKRVQEFMSHPNMVKAYIRAGQKFLDSHPDSVPAKRYADIYEWLVRDIFYIKEADWQKHKSTMFSDDVVDYKSFLENYFNIKL